MTLATSPVRYVDHPGLVGDAFPAAKSAEQRKQFELTRQQVAFFNENGYLAPIRLLSDELVQRFREKLELMIRDDYARADELFCAPRLKPGETKGMIYFQQAWMTEEIYHDLVFSPNVTVPAMQLLGVDSIRFFHDQVFYKPAKHG